MFATRGVGAWHGQPPSVREPSIPWVYGVILCKLFQPRRDKLFFSRPPQTTAFSSPDAIRSRRGPLFFLSLMVSFDPALATASNLPTPKPHARVATFLTAPMPATTLGNGPSARFGHVHMVSSVLPHTSTSKQTHPSAPRTGTWIADCLGTGMVDRSAREHPWGSRPIP